MTSPRDADHVGRTRRVALACAALAVIVLTSVWIRWPGFTQGGFASHDVAGILYSAMLLDSGGLPYVDSVEFKAPGTFYLAWWLADGGLDIAAFQVWANLWALASLVAVAVVAWRLLGPASAVMAAALYGLHDAMLDTMDANYVTWSQLPAIIAVGVALEGMRALSRRAQWLIWATAGVFAGWATLLKQPAVFSIAFVLIAGLWPRGRDGDLVSMAGRARRLLGACLGLTVAGVPIAAHYASAGELRALFEGFVLNRWGWEYAGSGTALLADDAAREGLLATLYFLALPLALAGFAGAAAFVDPRARSSHRTSVVMLLIWFALALASAAIGFRFFKGYFLAALPPLCVLAAAPWGLLRSLPGLRRPLRLVVLLPLLLLGARQCALLAAERSNRALVHDAGGKIIARHVREHTRDDDRIWVWGWHLWDVYVYAQRLAGTRFYKTLDLTTHPNDATWRRPSSPLRFSDGPAAAALLEELERERPAYIVLGSSVPVAEFEGLRALLKRHYVRDFRVRLNRVQFWQRRDRQGM